MARPLRIQYPGAFYHVSARGNERKVIFKNRRDREKFLEYLKGAVERYGAVIHVYCLMDNHYHLLLETPQGNLSQIMQHLNASYTTYFNVKRKRSGHLFQGRYNAILVEEDAYALELSRYIHLNPVRAGMVARPEEHPWSSYVHYIEGAGQPEWLKTAAVLAYVTVKESEARQRYRRYVEDRLGASYENPLRMVVGGTVLGRESFVEMIRREHVDRLSGDRNLPAYKAFYLQRPMEQIIATVERRFKDDGMASKVAIHLCHRYSGERLRDIGECFGIGVTGVTQASRRLAEQAERDVVLGQQLNEVRRELGLCHV